MLISVIIPFHNSEKFISETLYSVLDQTYQDLEIICVDNNSGDGSIRIVKDLMVKFPRKVQLLHESRKGANYARNRGLQAAKGEFIQFLDADDIIRKNKLEFQAKAFISSDISMVVSDRVTMDEKLNTVVEKHFFDQVSAYPLNTAISRIIITGNPLYRKKFIDQAGGWDESLPNAQDWELNIRAVLKGAKIAYCPGEFLISRSVRGSLSSDWKKVSDTSVKIIQKYFNDIVSFPEKLNERSWRKIFFLFYLSALNANEENKKELFSFIRKNIPDWKKFISNPAKRLFADVFGLNNLAMIEKLLK